MSDTNQPTFESLRLLPGQVLQLEFEGYEATRDRSQLIGYHVGRSVLISTPTKQGVPMTIKPKTMVKVRFFANTINGVCAFISKVIKVSQDPFPYLHLEVPNKLFIGEIRKSIRADVTIDATAQISKKDSEPPESKSEMVVIDNVSIDGARIYSQDLEIEKEDVINLEFKVDVSNIERELKLPTVVRSIQFNTNQGKYIYGLEFTSVSEFDRITLHAFVLSQIHSG